ncbi:hypothetical protein BT96DRAFT_42071 [Gymnopus androsaceus JB14]|uniref:MYND-type domain-containing protein n=1 Tax=Gymnopus androsaceus JB14 TaxID=1447944 RepID=A0A6A4HK88_9AGAR|nr:hypothetical protein BT96DRAFT_42071 [Gymnopus androsaceus JB14]
MEPRTDLPDGHRFQTCQSRTCLKTSKEAGQMRTCSGCKRASYCSRACQRADFKRHKPICASNIASDIQTKSLDEKMQNLAESLRSATASGSLRSIFTPWAQVQFRKISHAWRFG